MKKNSRRLTPLNEADLMVCFFNSTFTTVPLFTVVKQQALK